MHGGGFSGGEGLLGGGGGSPRAFVQGRGVEEAFSRMRVCILLA